MRDFPKKGKNRPKMNKSPENKKSPKNAKIAPKIHQSPKNANRAPICEYDWASQKKGNGFSHSAKLQKSMKKTKLPKNKKSKHIAKPPKNSKIT